MSTNFKKIHISDKYYPTEEHILPLELRDEIDEKVYDEFVKQLINASFPNILNLIVFLVSIIGIIFGPNDIVKGVLILLFVLSVITGLNDAPSSVYLKKLRDINIQCNKDKYNFNFRIENKKLYLILKQDV